MSVTLQFRWTEADYASARYHWSLRHTWSVYKQFPELGYAVGALFLALFILAISLYQDHRPDWQGAYALAAGGLLLCGLPAFLGLRWRIHRDFRRTFPGRTDGTATIDDGGVTLSTGGAQKKRLWTGFTRIYESRRVIVMESGGTDFIFLPKSAMSGAQLDELKRLTTKTLDCNVKLAAR